MEDWRQIYTNGPCKTCGETFSELVCIRGFCLACRQPEEYRELVRFGVPPGSGQVLLTIARKCNGDAEFVLGKVHPRLMENISVNNGVLQVRDKSYVWQRRVGWVKN